MNVIRHDDRNMQLHGAPMIMTTGFERNRTRSRRQYPAVVSAEVHHMRSIVMLNVWKMTAHRRQLYVGFWSPRARAPAAAEI